MEYDLTFRKKKCQFGVEEVHLVRDGVRQAMHEAGPREGEDYPGLACTRRQGCSQVLPPDLPVKSRVHDTRPKENMFITCLSPDEWLHQGPAGLDNGGDEVSGGDEKSTNSGINEMLFLL